MSNLDTWNNIKQAAEHTPEGIVRVALNLWSRTDARAKVGHDRAHREAFAASLVGAFAVDHAIEKMAESGEVKALEAQYLRALNADAAMRDLSEFAKSAGFLDYVKAHPGTTGAVIGGAVGAGTGAYLDDDNRLRGAVRFGIPGAVTGALLGRGISQLRAEDAAGLAAATREQEDHAARIAKTRAEEEAAKMRAAASAAQQSMFEADEQLKHKMHLEHHAAAVIERQIAAERLRRLVGP